ncbi:Myosin-binding protein C, fast-type [Fukomys damarensis]|uniref:Myosin-binding protein C, fast-type n=1 Tax=Fukomys damarensis TaxID=885580 RepID=A0A091D565_FUKDA|nr:Myosin-binding protein C, fast-type [Fukomys damarensis]
MIVSQPQQYPDGVFYDLDSCKHPGYPDSEGAPDSLWGWTEAPPVPATPYEAFDPAAASTFGHPQGPQLCYGPSAYGPAGTLEPAPSLETPGPGLPAYPTEDFTGQTLGPLAFAPYPSPFLSEEEELLLNSPALEVSDSESDEALGGSPEGRGSEAEKAGPPENVMVKEVWGTNALVEWQPPKDDGNSEITGYFIQKADKKTMEWFNVYEHNRHTSCTVSDLIVGNEYYFRVFSENICGLSDSPGVSKNTARILKQGLSLKPLDYKEHDFRMAPKFLTPLIDRVVVAGYSAALNCAVRGEPKPKVVWMKNKMEIREDPKFLMTNYQGVLTLNIRRPSPFDAGTYSCRAVNELGEALAECRLDVRALDGVSGPQQTWPLLTSLLDSSAAPGRSPQTGAHGSSIHMGSPSLLDCGLWSSWSSLALVTAQQSEVAADLQVQVAIIPGPHASWWPQCLIVCSPQITS